MSFSVEQLVATICARVLHGEIDPSEGIQRLSPYVSMDLDSNPSYASWKQPVSVAVPIGAADVEYGLDKYIKSHWSANRLRRWAAFITHTCCFKAPEPPPDDEDYNDELWSVLDELSTPAVFGEITVDSVATKRVTLKKYSLS